VQVLAGELAFGKMLARYSLRAAGIVMLLCMPGVRAATPEEAPRVRVRLRRSRVFRHSSNVSQRKRLNVNGLIAAPGTEEFDWGGLDSYTTRDLSLPSAIKITPAGDSLFRGRTEYSVSFDSLASSVSSGTRTVQFSDRLTFAATSVLFATDHFAVAFAPQLTTMLRDDSGVRLGATTIARYDGGGNTIAAIATWSAATVSSDSNPPGTWDFGGGFGRALGSVGVLSKITPHANVSLEKSTGYQRTLAAFGGLAYQVTEHLTADFSGQRYGLIGGGEDRQFLVSFTYVLGTQK
jgi:hypothetical protein